MYPFLVVEDTQVIGGTGRPGHHHQVHASGQHRPPLVLMYRQRGDGGEWSPFNGEHTAAHTGRSEQASKGLPSEPYRPTLKRSMTQAHPRASTNERRISNPPHRRPRPNHGRWRNCHSLVPTASVSSDPHPSPVLILNTAVHACGRPDETPKSGLIWGGRQTVLSCKPDLGVRRKAIMAEH